MTRVTILMGPPRRAKLGYFWKPHKSTQSSPRPSFHIPFGAPEDTATTMASAPRLPGTNNASGANKQPPGGPLVSALDAAAAPQGTKKGEYVTDDHVLDVTALATKFDTHVDVSKPRASRGLTTDEAERRLRKYGPNTLTPPKVKPQWLKYLIKLSDPFLVMLNLCGVLSIIVWATNTAIMINLYLGIVLFPVAFGTAFLTWYQVSLVDTVSHMACHQWIAFESSQH